MLGVATIVWAIWLGLKLLSWLRTYFVVTDQRVVYRTGVIARHGVEIPLDRINNINFHQGVWERMIGAGDLDIQSAGDEGTTLFENVRHPDGVQQEVYRQMENDAERDAGRGADAMGEAVAKAMSQQQRTGRRSRRRRPDGARADRRARRPARQGPHHPGGVRAEEGPAPREDVAPPAAAHRER